jgi:hypothetical protein
MASILNSEILINFSLLWGDVDPQFPPLLAIFENELFVLCPMDEFPEGIIPLFLLLFALLFWLLYISIASLIFFLWYKLSPLNVFSIFLFGRFLPIELTFLSEELLSVGWVVFVPTIFI